MTNSAFPSPVKSPAATNTPPVNVSKGRTSNRTAPLDPSRILTSATAPGPVPTATSGIPSPLKSATAVRSPPAVPGNGSSGPDTVPSGLNTDTAEGPPVSDPTAKRGYPTSTGDTVAGGGG